MAAAIARHDVIVRDAIAAHGGHVFATMGDGFAAAFSTPDDALGASSTAQRALAAERWPEPVAVRVRMGLHTGAAVERDGNYFGPPLNRTARLMAAGHGGQVLLSSAAAQLVQSAALLTDLGRHRLKNLDEPEHIFQLGDASYPPLRSVSRVRLPEWETRFVGRTTEMTVVREHLVLAQVVVLTGPGGVGKTRLASRIGRQLVDEMDDGVYFVGLAGIAGDAVGYAMAEAIGVRREPDRSPIASLAAWVADRRILLVVDNCEEVIPMARAAIEQLVSQCPSVRVIATSRVPLGVRGERRVPLQPLDTERAVELLVDRLAVHGRAVDRVHSDAALRSLTARLDGMPLALELAAARCRTLAPEELVARLDRRPELLVDTDGLFDERHRDLDRLLVWSYDQLSVCAATVLARLSVLIGSFTVDAAEAVARGSGVDDIDVVRALEELEDAGLVLREDHGHASRHRLLEPVRQHAEARLGDAEREVALDAHADFFRRFATQVDANADGPAFADWADALQRELSNLRQAHRRFVDIGDGDAAVDIVSGVRMVARERAIMEVADWCDEAVRLVAGRDDAVETRALASAVRFWHAQNRVSEVVSAADRAASLPGSDEDHLLLACERMNAELDPSRWPAAAAVLGDAAKRYAPPRPTHISVTTKIMLMMLGDMTFDQVQPEAAALGNPVVIADAIFLSAIPYYLTDQDAVAVALADEAMALARAAGAHNLLATTLMGVGGWRARLTSATDLEVFAPLLESLEMWERLRIPWGRISATEETAQALAVRGWHRPAFVLWGAIDASGLQAPSKVGRELRTRAAVASVTTEDRAAWTSAGAQLTLDAAMAFATRAAREAIRAWNDRDDQ